MEYIAHCKDMNRPILKKLILVVPTFVKSIHVQLTNKRRDVGVFEILPANHEQSKGVVSWLSATYDKTLEKSVDGVMTKLSLLFDQDMSSCILGSSNILAGELAY